MFLMLGCFCFGCGDSHRMHNSLKLYLALLALSVVIYVPSVSVRDLWYVPVALFLADVFSSIVHIVLDNGNCGVLTPYLADKSIEEASFIRERHPVIYQQSTGFQRTCFEFQKHHQYPSIILNKTFSEVCATIASITWSLHLLALLFHVVLGWMGSSVFFLCTITTVVGTLSQVAHQSAHASETRAAHPFIEWCRRWGLLISPASHRVHHRTYDRNFAIVNGWSHPFMNVLVQPLIAWGWVQVNHDVKDSE
jgi:hypothetical protein